MSCLIGNRGSDVGHRRVMECREAVVVLTENLAQCPLGGADRNASPPEYRPVPPPATSTPTGQSMDSWYCTCEDRGIIAGQKEPAIHGRYLCNKATDNLPQIEKWNVHRLWKLRLPTDATDRIVDTAQLGNREIPQRRQRKWSDAFTQAPRWIVVVKKQKKQ